MVLVLGLRVQGLTPPSIWAQGRRNWLLVVIRRIDKDDQNTSGVQAVGTPQVPFWYCRMSMVHVL